MVSGGAIKFKSNGGISCAELKFHAKTLLSAKKRIISPPVTLTYFVAGVRTIVRVAAEVVAGSPHRSMRGLVSRGDTHAAQHSVAVKMIGRRSLTFMDCTGPMLVYFLQKQTQQPILSIQNHVTRTAKWCMAWLAIADFESKIIRLNTARQAVQCFNE